MEKELFHANLDRVQTQFAAYPEAVPLQPVADFLGMDRRTLQDIAAKGEIKLKAKGTGRKRCDYVVFKTEIARYMS